MTDRSEVPGGYEIGEMDTDLHHVCAEIEPLHCSRTAAIAACWTHRDAIAAEVRAQVEREIVAHMRTTPTAGGRPISITSSGDIARLCDDILASDYPKEPTL